jgi:hypothetical protein
VFVVGRRLQNFEVEVQLDFPVVPVVRELQALVEEVLELAEGVGHLADHVGEDGAAAVGLDGDVTAAFEEQLDALGVLVDDGEVEGREAGIVLLVGVRVGVEEGLESVSRKNGFFFLAIKPRFLR